MDDILRPYYLDGLDCKAGKCRISCCTGWKIALTPDEISSLNSLSACPALSDRIKGSTDKNGFIMRDSGRCPLLSCSGLCTLRLEGIDHAVPSVCRAFPVSCRTAPIPACAASTACERVTEVLASGSEPFTLTGSPEIPYGRIPRAVFAAQMAAVSIMSNRRRSVSDNIADVLRFAYELSKCEHSLSAASVRCILNSKVLVQTEVCINRDSDLLNMLLIPLSGLTGVPGDIIRSTIGSIRFGSRTEQTGASAQSERSRTIPPDESNRLTGSILANHIFYCGFPYSDRFSDCLSEAAALTAFYVLIRLSSRLPGCHTDRVTIISRAFEHGSADIKCAEALMPCLLRDTEAFIAAVHAI